MAQTALPLPESSFSELASLTAELRLRGDQLSMRAWRKGISRCYSSEEFLPGTVNSCLLPNCAYCARLGVSTFHWFSFARNLSLNFFGTDCAQVFNFLSCPKVRNTHGSVGNVY
eukprot:COSAG02_NODE_1595_length_11773_cov_5.122739_8_plen_114_part_00